MEKVSRERGGAPDTKTPDLYYLIDWRLAQEILLSQVVTKLIEVCLFVLTFRWPNLN